MGRVLIIKKIDCKMNQSMVCLQYFRILNIVFFRVTKGMFLQINEILIL